nr:transposase, MuDR, MULE transposase domain protein [Tanacetum cinerariifolium]
MKKFNLKAIYPLNLSAKVSSIDDNFDITDDHEKWQKYISFKPDIPETPLYKSKPMISKDYKKETDVKVGKKINNKEALDLAIRLKALDEGYQFLNDRSAPERRAAIALALQNEFPLAYHVICCCHLMMNLSLKRDQTKALF